MVAIFRRFNNFIRRKRGIAPLPPRNLTEEELYNAVVNDRCPDCGGTGFFEGPHGGYSVNVFCRNSKCRSGFNVAFIHKTAGFIQRIQKGEDRYYDRRSDDCKA